MRRTVLALTLAGAVLVTGPAPASSQQPSFDELRETIDKLLGELERREDRRDLVLRQERALYELALQTGLDTDLPLEQVYPLDPWEPVLGPDGRPDLRAALAGRPEPADPTGERRRALGGYRQWLERAARGGVRLDAFGGAAAEVRDLASAQRAALRPAIEDEEISRGEILHLVGELRRMIESIEAPPGEPLATELEELLRATEDIRAGIESDDLVERATATDAALEGLLR